MIHPCSNCGAGVYVRPQHHFKDNYCNNTCRLAHPRQWIGYILQHCTTHTVAQIAAHIGIPFATLRTWCYQFNKELKPHGLRISFQKPTKVRKPNPTTKEKPKKKPKPKATPPPKPKITKTTYTPPPKKEPNPLPNRNIPTNAPGYRWVKDGNKYVQRKIA